jgi:2-polyprenyl-3-methyl-5-hydroxy-6-metoxy-1,4-benzoquinol methylase
MNILDEKPRILRDNFVSDYCSIFGVNKDLALQYIKTQEKFTEMTDDWYHYLNQGDIVKAYEVYNHDYYFTDLWTCFATYSRGYIRNVRKMFQFEQNSTIVDLGCGVALTTAALKQTYPTSRVIGTNIPDTKQWKFAQHMSSKYGFELQSKLQGKVDVVFASEYFEHIESPMEHIDDLIYNSKPKYFIIANAFNTRSIGHFKTYVHNGTNIDQSMISRLFNDRLRSHGYIKEKMPFFNNKPNVWRLV